MRRALSTLLATAVPALIPVGAGNGPVTDGAGVSAWQDHGQVLVLRDGDELGGEQRYPAPDGCALQAVGSGSLAFGCSPSGSGAVRPVFTDLASGTTFPPAGADAVLQNTEASLGNGEMYTIDGVGRALMSVFGYSDKGSGDLLDDLATGQVAWEGPVGRHQVRSLDTPSGTVDLCRPLQVTGVVVREVGETYWSRDPAAYRPPWLATLHDAHVLLRRCHRKATLDLGTSLVPPLLTDRYVAWATRRRLRVLLFASGRRVTVRLPVDPGYAAPMLEGTDRRVWILQVGPVQMLDLGTAP